MTYSGVELLLIDRGVFVEKAANLVDRCLLSRDVDDIAHPQTEKTRDYWLNLLCSIDGYAQIVGHPMGRVVGIQ